MISFLNSCGGMLPLASGGVVAGGNIQVAGSIDFFSSSPPLEAPTTGTKTIALSAAFAAVNLLSSAALAADLHPVSAAGSEAAPLLGPVLVYGASAVVSLSLLFLLASRLRPLSQRYDLFGRGKNEAPEKPLKIDEASMSLDQSKAMADFLNNAGLKDIGALSVMTERERIQCAKNYAAKNSNQIFLIIGLLAIRDERARIEIAKIAAAHDGEGTSEHIQNYVIRDEQARIEIAKIAAAHGGWGTSLYIQKYAIQNEQVRIEIAKIAAAHDGEGTSKHIQNYAIREEQARIEIAKIGLMEDPFSIIQHIQNYQIGFDPLDIATCTAEEVVAWVRKALAGKGLNPALAEALYADMKRRDVGILLGLELVFQWTVDQEEVTKAASHSPATLSRTLLEKATGMAMGGFKESALAYSEKALGDLYEMAASLRQPVTIGAGLFQDKKLKRLLEFMHVAVRLVGVLGLDAGAVFPPLLAREAGTTVDVDNVEAVIRACTQLFLERFKTMFKIGNQPITIEQIERLEEAWGNLEVLYTLVGRFNGNSRWKNEIPVLRRVVEHVLNGTFDRLKYEGYEGDVEDCEKVKAQLAMLSGEKTQAGWRGNYHRASLYRSGDQSPSLTPEARLERSKDFLKSQVIPHAQEEGRNSIDIDREKVREIRSALLREPKQVTILFYKRDRGALLTALLEWAMETSDLNTYTVIVNLMRSSSGAMGLSTQLMDDVKTLADKLKPEVQGNEAIVFTTTTDDPKLLLMTGDLVNVSSCQNYRTGSHIETLLGYVVDANVKLMLSYALTRGDFESQVAYEEVKRLVESGAAMEFVAAKQRLRIGGREIDLKRPFRRHVIKLGSVQDGSASMRMEKSYEQSHFAEKEMKGQIDAVLSELAVQSGATLEKEIQIPPTRNPGGVYSDAAGGVHHGIYTLTIS
ncbi:MAG: hypothetical protein Q7T03_04430 [Deltaproteobacteria bacterium]|nr:hypothetical protein [Deltaproteobacteria bacterium]